MSLVVNDWSVIGKDMTLGHAVAKGVRETRGFRDGDAPVLGDAVGVGVGAIILGKVDICRRARIGAGAEVLRDIPPGGVVADDPARVIRVEDDVQHMNPTIRGD